MATTPEEIAGLFSRLDPDTQLAVATLIRRLGRLPAVAPIPPPRQWPELMSGTQLRERLGISESTFFEYVRRGEFRDLEVKRPLGRLRYSSALVDKFLSGESVVRLGRGSRKWRQAFK